LPAEIGPGQVGDTVHRGALDPQSFQPGRADRGLKPVEIEGDVDRVARLGMREREAQYLGC
jgi:hypothetical protein